LTPVPPADGHAPHAVNARPVTAASAEAISAKQRRADYLDAGLLAKHLGLRKEALRTVN
jgi:hypothetical protein